MLLSMAFILHPSYFILSMTRPLAAGGSDLHYHRSLKMMSSNFLAKIIEKKIGRVVEAKRLRAPEEGRRAALDDETLARLLSLTENELGMDALVEVHTAGEMRRAREAGASVVGVNNRDLHTFEVRLDTSVDLAAHADAAGTLLVSESGIRGAEVIRRLRACGYGAFLVGETLMRAGRPDEALRSLTGADGDGLASENEGGLASEAS